MNALNPVDILKQYWGFDQFRPLQEDIVRSVLAGHDTLALLPTGGGKSICFQVPGLALGGLCLVISPLIALMKDQVLNLNRRGIKATALFTGMSRGEIDQVLEHCAQGKYQFLYVSPERLTTEIFLARLERLNVRLLAIDEAHCIAQWGHDFRPEYLRIAAIRPKLKGVPVIALTATATPEVVDEIQEQLGFKRKQVFQKSFSRANLAYEVLYEEDKFGKLIRIVRETPGTGVVYAGTRRKTQQLADLLKKNGVSADFYHAGLTAQERDARQKDWIDNKIRVICCTNAFGMGIDKPDVRFVVHLAPSDCIEAYFQEAGRAGRDEQPARCTLLYHPSDRVEAERNLAMGFPDISFIRQVYQCLGQHYELAYGSGQWQTLPFDLSVFCTKYELKPFEVHHALQFLHRAGYLLVGEEVLLPSKIKFTADATSVYDFRLKNREFDAFIDLLLRSYSGIMEQYCKIDEYKLAGKLKILSSDVSKWLEALQRLDLLAYVPKTDKATITWLKERLPHEKVVIPPEHYDHLRENKTKKLAAMLGYAEAKGRCRSQLLLAYFGEGESELCGQCDHCTGLQNSELSPELIAQLGPAIQKNTLKPISFAALVEAIDFRNKALLMNCVQWHIDQGLLQADDHQQLTWKA